MNAGFSEERPIFIQLAEQLEANENLQISDLARQIIAEVRGLEE